MAPACAGACAQWHMCRLAQAPLAGPAKLACMTKCSYCERPATTSIIANPHRVCLEHATEFWTGLLAYTRGRSEPCVKEQTLCACPACADTAAARIRSFAINSVGPSPGDHVDFQIAIAS
jgi:hypothetical protein